MQFNTIIFYAVLFGVYLNLDKFIGRTYEIKDKCAVVTGSSSGLGIYIAEALAKEGVSHLIVAARRLKKLQSVAGKLTSTYDKLKVKAAKVDVLSREDRENLQSEVDNFFPKDCVILNKQCRC